MKTISEIRDDLKEIRYYYSRKAHLDKIAESHKENSVLQKARLYDDKMADAPVRLYDLYTELYLDNNTQASLSDKWGYSPETIKDLNNKLCKYLQKTL